MRVRSTVLLLAALASGLVGCGDDAAASDAGVSDGGMDAGVFDAAVDAGPGDAGPPPPVAPRTDPEPVEVAQWLTKLVPGSAFPDDVRDGLRAGTFAMPVAGGEWRPITPGPEGQLAGVVGRDFYAVAAVDAGEGEGLIVRANRAAWTAVQRARQLGNPYGDRGPRVPFALTAGQNAVVVRGSNRRNTPEAQLFTTPDELYLNLDDTTTPLLRVGDDSTQWVGVPVLNLTDVVAVGATARVVENDWFEETTVSHPALAAGAASQVAFRLEPKAAWAEPDATVTATLRVESYSLDWSYERDIELTTVAADAPFRRTFQSAVDESAQYYGVRPPTAFDPARDYALVLALHGAGVQGLGHVRAYSAKDWAYIVGPTNRRPFGFDWEVWGRLDGIEVLDHAMASYRIDPTRVYLTGHSMGGHGTWQLGSLFPGRFAVIGPSAGWSSFYSYGGRARPGGAFARSMASSETNDFVSNLARRAVYIIHGDADTNVPIREGRDMFALVSMVTSDITMHEQPGAGHWWDDDPMVPGTGCVDWGPLFDLMQMRTLDPTELDFEFTTPSPWVSPTHSYVTVRSEADPWRDVTLTSSAAGGTVTLTTDNARSLVLDGTALGAAGATRVVVDGTGYDVMDGPLSVGPEDGKRTGVHGPLNEVFHRPFCFVYDPAGPEQYRHYAAYLLGAWAIIGNGAGCALPLDQVTPEVRASRNLIYLGLGAAAVGVGTVPVSWDGATVTVGGTSFPDSAIAFVFPEGDRLSGAVVAPAGSEHLLYTVMPFTSGIVFPDFYVWSEDGGQAAGLFDSAWAGVAAPP